MGTRIRITMVVDDDFADPGNAAGVTEEGYDRIIDALNSFGEDIDIEGI